ncbi:MAG TPA: hypothetical protein VL485_15280 [Ktedonobacteraceae bacterium]|jgi:hypothetical protein|nr:hypothetical protein [Ktedonobacteraceae bacterium]
MSLHQKRRETSARLPAVRVGPLSSSSMRCLCTPLSPLSQSASVVAQDECVSAYEPFQYVPATSTLRAKLSAVLYDLLPKMPALSILVLHIAQAEPPPVSSLRAPLKQRHYDHVPAGLREQIFANVRRVIRLSDRLWIEDEAGGALIFPDVDRYGMETILERVYQSICLLQAETVVPPLVRETTLLLGCGSFPSPGSALEQLLLCASQPARRLTLRPALFHQFAHTPEALSVGMIHASPADEPAHTSPETVAVPFLDLPRELPPRLKQLLPYMVASELRCAPVGRDHHRLTVAMANPHDMRTVQHLSELTGMTIFPVSCEIEDLEILLAKKW